MSSTTQSEAKYGDPKEPPMSLRAGFSILTQYRGTALQQTDDPFTPDNRKTVSVRIISTGFRCGSRKWDKRWRVGHGILTVNRVSDVMG